MKKVLLLSLAGLLFACSQTQPGAEAPLENARAYANALYNQQLHWLAVAEYEKILDKYKMDDKNRANITFTIANINFEDIRNYASALSYYLKIKYLYDDEDLREEVNKRIVACLERLGKSSAAAAYLKETTSLKGEESPLQSLPGDTVAVVGSTVITPADLNRLFRYYRSSLTEEERKKEPTEDDKIEFLLNYVKSEALYNSAVMQRIDEDPEIVEITYLRKKQLVVNKLLQNEVHNKIKISDEEIKVFYNENKSILTITEKGKKKTPSLDEARDDIRQIIYMQKSQKLQDELTDRLIEAQKARVFSDRIK